MQTLYMYVRQIWYLFDLPPTTSKYYFPNLNKQEQYLTRHRVIPYRKM